MLFLSAVSGATVALALVAQLDRMGDTFLTFALAVLPALLALGVTSCSRLTDLAVHDAYYAREAVADIVNNLSWWSARSGPTLKT